MRAARQSVRGVARSALPYVLTTYRLTEHHTAGGMSRTLPHLAELQPEFFCEISPELAREHRDRERRAASRSSPARHRSRRARSSRRACGRWHRRPDGPPGRRPLSLGLARPRHTATSPTIWSRSRKSRTCASWSQRGSSATCGPAAGLGAGRLSIVASAHGRSGRDSLNTTVGFFTDSDRVHRLQGVRGGLQGMERWSMRV